MNKAINRLLTSYQQTFPQPIFFKGEKRGFRHRVKLAVRGKKGAPIIGLFKPGTHEIAPLENCSDHPPLINEKIGIVKQALIDWKISPYQETSHQGIVRYVQLTKSRESKDVELAFALNIPDPSYLPESFFHFLKELAPHFFSIWLNSNSTKGNSIFSSNWYQCAGKKLLTQSICGKEFPFHPGAFMQTHLELFEKVIRSIQKSAIINKNTLELYSGVGVIGSHIASKKTTFVEINPFSAHAGMKNLKQGSSAKYAHLIHENEVVIVDPPRKGLDIEVLEELCASNKIEQLIYLSCNPQSLEKDLSQLLQNGFEVTLHETYDFFPGTPHIETLMILKKSG